MIRACLHCGEDTKKIDEDFCCLGCAAAYKIINKLGFENYYSLREINPNERKIKPELEDEVDISEFVFAQKNDEFSVSLMVQGLHCAACVWLIESILKKQKNVLAARINLTQKTLFLKWRGAAKDGNNFVHLIAKIGYKLLPFDEKILQEAEKKYNNSILRALAVAGFGMGNIMLFSLAFWAFDVDEMGAGTRNLLQFFSALIALPVIIFSARPFFSSAAKSIKAGYPNMDLAISIAIFLACLVSLFETFNGAAHVYFDSAVMLIFFLLIGRYLDLKARKKAFSIASEFSLLAASFGRVEENSRLKILPSNKLEEGMILVVAPGEKIAADGVVLAGESQIDTSLITGESLPKKIAVGELVFAGTLNLSFALKIRITKSVQNSLLAQIIRLSEEVESKKNRYIRIADRLAKFYLPAVHILALVTFCFWFKSGFEVALMSATAVLIITCPCALALAVPIVQTITISNFIRRKILVKSGEALEKLNEIEVVVFDKTGSLTLGELTLIGSSSSSKSALRLAASMAKKSRHPISKAILAAYDGDLDELEVREITGLGLETNFAGKLARLGRQEFCGIEQNNFSQEAVIQSFLKFGEEEIIFYFADKIKTDAKQVISRLQSEGKKIILLSGDQKEAVQKVASELEIAEFYFSQTPISKVEFLENLRRKNKKFVMVGDGLNDAPALGLADVSISFSKAYDITQNIADIVIQGDELAPLIELFSAAKKSISLMKQNLIIALIYNLIAVPFACAGKVVPLVAAIAMSSSSLLVLLNSLRMNHNQKS